jgi:hypothetical protein
MQSTALSLNQRQCVEAVIAALPHLAEVVAAIPPDSRIKAFEAAERSYLRTFRQSGLSGPETWASSVMRRLRRRVREADLTERDKLKKLYEQLSTNECLETAGQGRSLKIHDTTSPAEQENIGREGKSEKPKLYRQVPNDEQIAQARSFDTHDEASSEGEFNKQELHEQASAVEQIGQEKKIVGSEDEFDKQRTIGEQIVSSRSVELAGSSGEQIEREGEFDKLKLHEQADEQIGQAHNFDAHGTASSEGEFDKPKVREQLSAGDQIGQADSFDLNDAASSGGQKDVGREGAKKAAVVLRMTKSWIDIDEIFGGAAAGRS